MRRIITLLLCLSLSVAAFSQDLTGIWIETVSQNTAEGFGMTSIETLNLMADKTFTCQYDLRMEVPTPEKKEIIRLKAFCAGTWDCSDDMLTQTFDHSSLKSEVVEFPESLPDQIMNYTAKAMISEMKKHTKKPVKSDIIELTSDSLKMIEIGSKNAEVETYIRSKD